MLPLRDVIPSRTAPLVTLALITVTAVAFVFELALGERREDVVVVYGVVPADPRGPAFLISMFLHAGPLQLACNMLYLWIFGHTVEDRMGHGRFLTFYLLCGVAAALAHATLHPRSHVPLIGAGGAVAGVIGAYFSLYPRSRILTLVPVPFLLRVVEMPAAFYLGLWFLLQLASDVGTVVSAVDGTGLGAIWFWAQCAGLVAGAAGVRVFRRPERLRVEWWEKN